MLGRRGFALESAAGRICREAGGRVTSNVLIRDLDLPVPANGLPLFDASWPLTPPLVCALHCDGSPHNGAADADGVVLQAARRRKERTYPELVGPRTRGTSRCACRGGGGQMVQ